MRNILKLGLVLRVRLDAQRRCEDELANGCAEAGKEGVERLFNCKSANFLSYSNSGGYGLVSS
jgi:hypothetical protein